MATESSPTERALASAIEKLCFLDRRYTPRAFQPWAPMRPKRIDVGRPQHRVTGCCEPPGELAEAVAGRRL